MASDIILPYVTRRAEASRKSVWNPREEGILCVGPISDGGREGIGEPDRCHRLHHRLGCDAGVLGSRALAGGLRARRWDPRERAQGRRRVLERAHEATERETAGGREQACRR
jgi:hypothetical protein